MTLQSLLPLLLACPLLAQTQKPLPTVDHVVSKYVAALGGEAALAKITSRAAGGTIFVATYGAYGEYREYAKAPNQLVRSFRFPQVATLARAFDGRRAWEESPDYGVEILSGDRLSQVQRLAVFEPALQLRTIYPKLAIEGRAQIDQFSVVGLSAVTPSGEQDVLWFDEATGLLIAADSTETFSNGVSQRVRYQYEEYRPIAGIPVAHRIRYESPRLIWVIDRQVALNVPVDGKLFLPPDEQHPPSQ